MVRETEITRAIRRAQHDTYAPFTVRPAVRREFDDRLWNDQDEFRSHCKATILITVSAVAAVAIFHLFR